MRTYTRYTRTICLTPWISVGLVDVLAAAGCCDDVAVQRIRLSTRYASWSVVLTTRSCWD